MGISRLYTGSDGLSHIEDIDLDSHPELQELQKVEGIWIAKCPAGPTLPQVPEPAKRWMVVLSGRFEAGLPDGSKHQYVAGDIRLVEDTTGPGHTSRFVEPTAFMVIEVEPGHGPWEHADLLATGLNHSFSRLYAGDDGESHIEELSLDSHPGFKELEKVAEIWLAQWPAGPPGPFALEPCRRWMVLLSGKFEAVLGNGSKHQYGPCALRLVEDTTGHGHISQFIEPSMFLVVESEPGHGPRLHKPRS